VLPGLAALAVAWFHITHGGLLLAAIDTLLITADGVGAVDYHGITLFFVLCGFVIPCSIRNDPRVQGLKGSVCGLSIFLLKRLLSFPPPYLLACILALSLNWISTLAPGYRGPFSATPPQASACSVWRHSLPQRDPGW
jgi:peptidoglycan/LPS O-acetylase OafA/YrhL